MYYPATWSEFEDGEGSFLFYNPEKWSGNFRISAFRGEASYAKESIREELKENPSASRVKIGEWECVYGKELFEEDGNFYTNHYWLTGENDLLFECSMTVAKGESVAEAEAVIASLEVRKQGMKYPAEIIPVRLAQGITVILGAVTEPGIVWLGAEIVNGLMTIPNLIALAGLSPEVIRLIKDYEKRSPSVG